MILIACNVINYYNIKDVRFLLYSIRLLTFILCHPNSQVLKVEPYIFRSVIKYLLKTDFMYFSNGYR